jgi:UDP-2,3-diacylglucosamine pyrophosphatase LpxH
MSQFLATVPDVYNADFVVVTGDNIDFFEAQTAKGNILDTQIEQYSEFINNYGIQMYLALGNHDLTSYMVTPDSNTTNNQLKAEKAKSVWMRNFECFREGTYYSRILKIDTMDFRLIFLDNSYYATREVSDGVVEFVMDPYQTALALMQSCRHLLLSELIFSICLCLSQKLRTKTSRSNSCRITP